MKGRILKKCLVYTLIGTLTLSNVTPALAYDHLDKVDYDSNKNSIAEVHEKVNVTENSTSQATVYAELGKEFTITIPKSLTLDGKTKTGSYTVDVEGDIAGTDKINVVPDKTFTLNSSGLDSVTASIAQDKTSWGYDEILTDSKVIGNGAINASDLTAGKWNGTFNFNINLEEGTDSDNTGNEEQSILTLSVDDEVAIGSNDSLQVNAYLEGELVNDLVDWQSDNNNITVTDGLIKTKASAQVGDSATITVTAENPSTLSAMANTLNDLGIATVAMADNNISVQFTVTVIDMVFTSENKIINSIDIKPNEKTNIEVTIIPASVSGDVIWSTTAISGINLIKNKNTVIVEIADDMPTGKTYNLIATYGDYSKTLPINIIADHVCNYEETITKNATCMETGIKTFNCTCGDSYTEEIPVDNTAHDYESEWTTIQNPSCTEKGLKVQYCSICTYALNEEEINETGHSFGEWTEIESPKCEATGSEQRICDTCGYTETKEISATGHSWEDDYTVDVPATCETDGSKSVHCTNCEATKYSTVVPATGHSYPDNWTETKSATCTKTGLEQKVCSACNKIITQEIATTGHTEVVDAAVAATCTETGLTEGKHCSVCNEILIAQITISAKGHNHIETVTKATCTTDGNRHFECDACSDSYDETITKLGHSASSAVKENEIKSTCTEKGSYNSVVYCAICNAKLNSETITTAALGHSFSNWTTVENSTCTKVGYEQRICDTCNLVETNDLEIASHNWEDNYTIDKTATCEEAGSKSVHCANCSATKYSTEIAATGHSYPSFWTKTKEATCTEKGSEQKTCSACGNVITQEIPATGHTEVIGGTKESHSICSICNNTLSSKHEYTSIVAIEPTCAINGTTRYICSCGYNYAEQNITALGHNFKEGFCTICNEENSARKDNIITLSSTFANITNEKEVVITILENKANTKLSITNSDDNVVIINVKENEIMITPVNEGVSTITIESEANNDYRAAKVEIYINVTHSYENNGYCSRCNEFNINYLTAGLYDTNYNLLKTWDELLDEGVISVTNETLKTQFYTDSKGTQFNPSDTVLNNNIIVINNDVKKFHHNAFTKIKINKLVLPTSITSLSKGFYGATLQSVILKEGNPYFKTVDDVIYNTTMTTLIKYPSGKTDEVFNVPKSVTNIGYCAFWPNSYIKTVNLPDGLTTISSEAFTGCSNIKTMDFPETLTSIGQYSLPSITVTKFPNKLKTIESNAMRNLKNKTIYIPASVTTCGGDAYTNPANNVTTYRGIFTGASQDLIIYCEASAKPSGWNSMWNCRGTSNINDKYTVKWGYTYEQYLNEIGQ